MYLHSDDPRCVLLAWVGNTPMGGVDRDAPEHLRKNAIAAYRRVFDAHCTQEVTIEKVTAIARMMRAGAHDLAECCENLASKYRAKEIRCNVVKACAYDLQARASCARRPLLARLALDCWYSDLLGSHAPK